MVVLRELASVRHADDEHRHVKAYIHGLDRRATGGRVRKRYTATVRSSSMSATFLRRFA